MSDDKQWKSIILWPDEVYTGNNPNESIDYHRTKAAAEYVCRQIKQRGMGLLGKVYPISTRVEPPTADNPSRIVG